MVNVWNYNPGDLVKVVCTGGDIIEGEITSIDDEEESGLGEDGISVMTKDKSWIGIAQSEITSISVLDVFEGTKASTKTA